ncbi:MAG: hypothetical protein ACKD6N_02660 [Candidatus Bathyarchaeota archaeon]
MWTIFLKKKREEKFRKKFGKPVSEKSYPEKLSFIFLILITGLAIFFASGGIYDFFRNPPPVIVLGESRLLFFIPGDLSVQTMVESIFSMIILLLGFLGFLMLNRASKSYSTRQTTLLFAVGLILIVVGVSLMELLLLLK